MQLASSASAVLLQCPNRKRIKHHQHQLFGILAGASILSISCLAFRLCRNSTVRHHHHELAFLLARITSISILLLTVQQTDRASSASAVLLFAQATTIPNIISISCSAFCLRHEQNVSQAHQDSSASAVCLFNSFQTCNEHHQHQLFCSATSSTRAVPLFAHAAHAEHNQHQLFCFAARIASGKHHQHQLVFRLACATNEQSIISISCSASDRTANGPSIISISCFSQATTVPNIISISRSTCCPCHQRNEHRQHQLLCCLPMSQTHQASSASAV